ncbi:MAG: primosomal protein N', partial [Streptococcus gallolyticus]|nr:primosomal protein N' [Streptococcus gallolyticus]
MVKIAQVIVDVPLMQTDKPFSYIIPKDVEDQVTIGSRVHVPFGRGNRLLQGFVVGFSDTFDNTVTDLKAISEVLDFEPVLNAEQLELAEQMRHTVFSYKISILKSMIPNLLNSQYDKRLTPTESLSSEEHLALFGEKESRLHSSLTEEEAKKVARLVQAGKITVDYLAKDKKNIKTEKYYHVQAEKIAAADISNRAKKRLELRDYLLEHPEEGKLSDLHHLFSRDVVKFFVDNQLITVLKREKKRSDAYFDVVTTDFLDLNAEQAAVVEQVTSQIGQESKPFLLEGVTGSGKTEVYLHIIDKVLKLGKTAIVLVPEISLTPQMTNRFISRFGKQVAIMHSALSDGEKFDEWRKIKSGQARVVVGARSAIFVPIENIGAIIIDEEHEATYKQESNPRYHARDVALLRAKYHKAILLMGSATPSIESRARASRGVYQFLQLTHRANPMAKIPKVEIVDFRDYVGQQEVSNFTPYLLEKIADRLEKNEQVVLMLNRRGYS